MTDYLFKGNLLYLNKKNWWVGGIWGFSEYERGCSARNGDLFQARDIRREIAKYDLLYVSQGGK